MELFKLFGSVFLKDEATPGLDKIDNRAEQTGSRLSGFGKGALAVGAAVGTAAITAGAAAISLGKTVVAQFGELEQNLGGSEAVFGEYATKVQKTGEDAYKNMGVSQSQYLATANKMGALFQGSGVDQEKSLTMTTDAMQRAADMASVMGIDMQVALDSVAGAAKGNFTMMDNLGVSMNATSIEAYAMSKGIKDFSFAEASASEKAELAMQMFMENTSQYAGNFAKESTETIGGSMGLLKAALGSFTAGLGNADADMGNLANNVVDAFQAVVKNVVPIIENLVSVLPEALAPILKAVGSLLPKLLPVVTDLFKQVLQVLLELFPEIIPVVIDALLLITQTLIENLPLIIDSAIQLVTALITGITEALPMLIPAAIAALMQIVDGLITNLPLLLDAALQLITALAEGLIAALPQLIEYLPTIIMGIVNFLVSAIPQIINAGVRLLISLVEALPTIIQKIVAVLPQIINSIITALMSMLPQLIDAGIRLFIALIANLPLIITEIVKAIPKISTSIVSAIIGSVPQLMTAGGDLIRGLWQGISNAGAWLRDKISGFFGGVVDSIKSFFGIGSPSKLFEGFGVNIDEGFAGGIDKGTGIVEKAAGRLNEAAMVGAEIEPVIGSYAAGAATPAYQNQRSAPYKLHITGQIDVNSPIDETGAKKIISIVLEELMSETRLQGVFG